VLQERRRKRRTGGIHISYLFAVRRPVAAFSPSQFNGRLRQVQPNKALDQSAHSKNRYPKMSRTLSTRTFVFQILVLNHSQLLKQLPLLARQRSLE